MILRAFQESDPKTVKEIFTLYWTNPEFLKELLSELQLYVLKTPKKDFSIFNPIRALSRVNKDGFHDKKYGYLDYILVAV